jgi:hypothetical protein
VASLNKNGHTSVHDDQRSRRPSIVTGKIVEKIKNVLHDDRTLTVDEFSAMFPQSPHLCYAKPSQKPSDIGNCPKGGPQNSCQTTQLEARQEFFRRYKLP